MCNVYIQCTLYTNEQFISTRILQAVTTSLRTLKSAKTIANFK